MKISNRWKNLQARIGLLQWTFALIIITLPVQGLLALETADVNCTGAYCSKLPYSDAELDSIMGQFKLQYADKLFDDMAEAAVMANLSGIPIGTVNLQKFALGASASVGYRPVHYERVDVPGLTTVEDLPSAGVAIVPKFYFGVNLGAVMGMSYDPFKEAEDYEENGEARELAKSPSIFSPLRFDLYLTYSKLADSYKVKNSDVNIDYDSYFRGGELRYHLLEGGGIIAGPMLRFRGLSMGIGMYKSRQNFVVTQSNSDMKFDAGKGLKVAWEGTDVLRIDNNIDSYTLDFRSGIQLLYLLNLTGGVGVAANKGSSDYIMSRTGPVSLTADPLLIAGLTNGTSLPANYQLPQGADTGLTQAQYEALINNGSIPNAGVLTMYISGSGNIPRYTPYARIGVEINAWVVKISVEALATKRSYAANAGVRVEF